MPIAEVTAHADQGAVADIFGQLLGRERIMHPIYLAMTETRAGIFDISGCSLGRSVDMRPRLPALVGKVRAAGPSVARETLI